MFLGAPQGPTFLDKAPVMSVIDMDCTCRGISLYTIGDAVVGVEPFVY